MSISEKQAEHEEPWGFDLLTGPGEGRYNGSTTQGHLAAVRPGQCPFPPASSLSLGVGGESSAASSFVTRWSRRSSLTVEPTEFTNLKCSGGLSAAQW